MGALVALVGARLLSRRADVTEVLSTVINATRGVVRQRGASAVRKASRLARWRRVDEAVEVARERATSEALLTTTPEVTRAPHSIALELWAHASEDRIKEARAMPRAPR